MSVLTPRMRFRPHVLSREGEAVVDTVTLDKVLIEFGYDDEPGVICGRCHTPIRSAVVDGEQIWLARGDDEDEWVPWCEGGATTGVSDACRLAAMAHVPDRSVTSWALAAHVKVDDARGLLSLVVTTGDERFVLRVRRSRDGRFHMRARRFRRRHSPLPGGREAFDWMRTR